MATKAKEQDLKHAMSVVIKTGKIKLGFDTVRSSLLSGNLKLVIMSSNCHLTKKEDIIYYSKLAKTRYHIVDERSQGLGTICGKPYAVSALGIVNEGDSDILNMMKR